MNRTSAKSWLLSALPSLFMPAMVAAQGPAAEANGTQICLAPVAVEAAPNGMDPVTAVRDAFANFLTGPSLEVRPLRPWPE